MSGRPHAALGVLLTQTSQTGCSNGGDRISQVPGEPLWHAALSISGKPLLPGHYGIRVSPSAPGRASALALRISELTRAAYSLAVYASQPGLPPVHARLASGWRPPLPCGIPTRRVRQRGFRSYLQLQVIPSPSSRLCLAHTWQRQEALASAAAAFRARSAASGGSPTAKGKKNAPHDRAGRPGFLQWTGYYILATIASPNPEHDVSVAPSIWRWRS